MKVFLMYVDRDFDLQGAERPHAAELIQDLEINSLLTTMAKGDKFLLEIARNALLGSLLEPTAICYRQHILADCLNRPTMVRDMYAIAEEAIERQRTAWGWMSGRYPEGTLYRALELLQIFTGLLKRLRQIAAEYSAQVHSEGFNRLFCMLAEELDDEYLTSIEEHLQTLTFRGGVLVSAEIGKGCKGNNYVLRKPSNTKASWIDRLKDRIDGFLLGSDSEFVYEVDGRDESGFRALSELKSRGISQVAAALAQSSDHILSFFRMLQVELGFYIGCLNLYEHLVRKGEPTCFPRPLSIDKTSLSARGLYDVCLSLNMAERVVGNDVSSDDKLLLIITGANRGGKSTFLRSVGLAQLMMQCGLIVPAQSFCANVCDGVYTHFKRQEDANMRSGKLDEELRRMSALLDSMSPNSMVLFNESFASTNEREGSELARQIVRALVEGGIKVLYVTHMFDLARGFYSPRREDTSFLRAERLVDGQRTFRLFDAEPLRTSYGEDLYRRIFGTARDGAAVTSREDLQPRRC
jgi:hypothetical protein